MEIFEEIIPRIQVICKDIRSLNTYQKIDEFQAMCKREIKLVKGNLCRNVVTWKSNQRRLLKKKPEMKMTILNQS